MNQPCPKIDLNGLSAEHIEQIQMMINSFKQQNQLEVLNHQTKESNQSELMKDILFESEILQPFNRQMLYGERI